MMRCFDYVAHGGEIIYVGLFVGNMEFSDPIFHAKEITLKSSRNSLPEDYTKIIRLQKSGLVNIDGLVTHTLQFADLEKTFTHLYSSTETVIKAVVEF